MSKRVKYLLAGLAVLVAFAGGRYSVPESAKESSKSSETEKKSAKETEDLNVKKKKTKTVTETTGPDGTKTKTETEVVESEKDSSKSNETKEVAKKTEESSKEVTRSGSRLTVSALAGSKISFSSSTFEIDYGGMVTKEIIGPISIGAFGFKSGMAGVALGLTF